MSLSKDSSIFLAGHSGMLGSAVLRKLKAEGYDNLILRTRQELDLEDQAAVFSFFETVKPGYVILCAAKVGGIKANMTALGEFLYKNLQVELNVIEGARRAGVKKLLFVASTCIYPVNAQVPITEDQLFTGPLEPTNEGYAIAKITGVKLCSFYKEQYDCNFISAIPSNLYGVNDHFGIDNAHVLQSLIRKVHFAKKNRDKKIILWGSGKPMREFMYSDDCADGLVFMLNHYEGNSPLNIGTGIDHSIIELAQATAKVLDYPVSFEFDSTKPDGIFRKLCDVSKLSDLGWQAKTNLETGIELTYKDFLKRYGNAAIEDFSGNTNSK